MFSQKKSQTRQSFQFSLVKKFVTGITVLSVVTYGTSAFFIFFLKDFFSFIPYGLYVLSVLSLGIIWSGILGWIAARWLIKPITRLNDTAQKASTGDLTVNVDIPKGRDELRALSESFQQMIVNLRDMIHNIQDNSRQTTQSVDELKNATDMAANQTEAISHTIEEIARGAEKQALASQVTLSSIEEVNRLSEQANGRATRSKEQTDHMVKTIRQSTMVVESLVQGMQRLAEENEASIQVVRRLEQNAREIGDISEVVGEIAEQTNLLALNASIEAARAGEHGKGFAVVAEEVRKLADQSSQAVQDINRLIKQMQEEVGHSVKQIESQVELASRESRRGQETTQALRDISHSVNDVVVSVEEIVELIKKQAENMAQTAAEAREVAAVAQQTSAGAEEVAASTQEQTAVMEEIASSAQVLYDQAMKLQQQVSKFRI